MQILAEFKDPVHGRTAYKIDLGWAGDVKSLGRRAIARRASPCRWRRTRAISSSSTRSSPAWRAPPGPRSRAPGKITFDPKRTLPILIHGDAAFPGQGMVAETLNLSRLAAIAPAARSTSSPTTRSASPPTRARPTARPTPATWRTASRSRSSTSTPTIPIACIEAARVASAYRSTFQKDVIIDLIGYRRYGHNEGDEPSFTQPLLYAKVAEHPTVRRLWADQLIARGKVTADAAEVM